MRSDLPRFLTTLVVASRPKGAQLYIMVGDFLSRVSVNAVAALSELVKRDTASIRTLRRALATVGSEARLATELNARRSLNQRGARRV